MYSFGISIDYREIQICVVAWKHTLRVRWIWFAGIKFGIIREYTEQNTAGQII